ncbi:MAG: response regulator transcription factor [Gemmatimonadota bacterium]
MTSVIRVLVADDHSVVREGLRHVLAGAPGFEVVAEAATAAEAMTLAERHAPDVLVLDISMPGGSGLGVVEEIRRRLPDVRILMLSIHDQREYVVESVRAGAHGYLRKDSTPAELRAAITAVHREGAYFSPSVARHLGAALRGDATTATESTGPVLTPREREVLVRVARGLTNKETAAELGISTRTVEAHRDSLSRKLGIKTVAGLTRYVMEQEMGQS